MKRKRFVSLICTRRTFCPIPTDATRWWASCDWRKYVTATDGALGWGNPPLSKKDWVKYYAQGYRFCATLKRGRAVAVAGLWPRPGPQWQVVSNGLKLGCEHKGYAEEILAFVADEILKTRRDALFMVRPDNRAWVTAAKAVGFLKRIGRRTRACS